MTAPDLRKIRRRRLGRALLVLALLLVADGLLYPLLPVAAPPANRGENGLWLRYTWYFGKKTEAEWAALTARLRDAEVRDAFFHVRAIGPDGRLRYRYRDRARALTARLHRAAPGVRVIAWIYAENKPGDFYVDVGDPAVRARMVAEAVWLVRVCGFDGVQWDYEVIRDGDRRLPALLRETRAALPGVFLSVCTPPWYPEPAPRVYGWRDAYFREIAGLCDQLAVMAYDTAMPSPRLYAALLRAQAVHVPRAAARGNPRCRVLIGVPSYGTLTKSHYPGVENLPQSLKAVRAGLADPAADPAACAGVAVFADYTTSDDEWAAYRRIWLGR